MKDKMVVLKRGSTVQWKWMGRVITGTVKQIYVKTVEKTIKGKLIKRNGSEKNPAYYVMSNSGNFALKLHSELLCEHTVEDSTKSKSARPRMFSS